MSLIKDVPYVLEVTPGVPGTPEPRMYQRSGYFLVSTKVSNSTLSGSLDSLWTFLIAPAPIMTGILGTPNVLGRRTGLPEDFFFYSSLIVLLAAIFRDFGDQVSMKFWIFLDPLILREVGREDWGRRRHFFPLNLFLTLALALTHKKYWHSRLDIVSTGILERMSNQSEYFRHLIFETSFSLHVEQTPDGKNCLKFS